MDAWPNPFALAEGWDLGASDPSRKREYELFLAMMEDPAATAPRWVLADYLSDEGDEPRAEILRWISAVLDDADHAEVGGALRVLLEGLPPQHQGWARLAGAELVRSLAVSERLAELPRWFGVARAAVDVAWDSTGGDIQEVGATRYFGDPDLPPGQAWPTVGDCRSWMGLAQDVDNGLGCRFVAQFSGADLRQSPAGRGLSPNGLLSLFAFTELNDEGGTEVFVRWFPDRDGLVRRPHPALDEGNARLAPRGVRLAHTLDLPKNDGPWEQWYEMQGWIGLDEGPVSAHRMGLFGYTSPTTGYIELPNRGWQRLSCLPTDDERIVWNHTALPIEDLAAGRFDGWAPVWADLDG